MYLLNMPLQSLQLPKLQTAAVSRTPQTLLLLMRSQMSLQSRARRKRLTTHRFVPIRSLMQDVLTHEIRALGMLVQDMCFKMLGLEERFGACRVCSADEWTIVGVGSYMRL